MTIEEVVRVAEETARGASDSVRVIGVTASPEGSQYAEIVIDIECALSQTPHRISIGVFRDAPRTDVQQAIGQRLRQHLQECDTPLGGN